MFKRREAADEEKADNSGKNSDGRGKERLAVSEISLNKSAHSYFERVSLYFIP